MTLVLTQDRIDELQGYVTAGNAVAYYTALSSWGSDYAPLALGVVQDNTVDGQIAREFVKVMAAMQGTSVNDSQIDDLAVALMQEDFALRNTKFTSQAYTGELSAADILSYHADVYDDANIPIEAWTPYIGYQVYGQDYLDAVVLEGVGFTDQFSIWSAAHTSGAIHAVPNVSVTLYAEWLAAQLIASAKVAFENGSVAGIYWLGDITSDMIESIKDADSEGLADWFEMVMMRVVSNATELASDIVNAVRTAFNAAETLGSPLVFDLDGDGIETTSLTGADAVYFDHDQDGFAEATGWVDADDGILSIDLNQDGIINDGAELFGDQTGFTNGFLALAQYDSNQDGKITGEDLVWSKLRVWQDNNNDGFSQSGELHTLDSLNITEIDLAYTDVSTTNNGNSIQQTGSFTISGNSRTVSDVYFALDKNNSTFNDEYELDARTLFLPTLRGYGTLPDLHVAMSLDNEGTGNLLELVQDFATLDFDDLFTSADVRDDIRAILYRWAGVESVTAGSRGTHVDAKELAFLEKLVGEDYFQRFWHSNPGPIAGNMLEEAFDKALSNFSAKLMIQGASRDLFTGDIAYNPVTDGFDGSFALNLTRLGELETEATGLANTAYREILWSNVVRLIEYSVGVSNLSSGDQSELADAIYDSDNTLSLSGILADLDLPAVSTVVSDGTTGNDTMTGGSVIDVMSGDDGNDSINGLAGSDQLYGEGGNDTLTGGAGDDYMEGGVGNDTYVYNVGDGSDTIEELDGSVDAISFGSGLDINDLTFTRIGNNDLVISVDDGSTIQDIIIQNQFVEDKGIETLTFTGSSSFDITTHNFTLYGTASRDTLYGVNFGGGDQDTIYGGDGDDTIYGLDGNDTLYGEAGSDRIEAGAGNNTVYGGDGADTIIAGSGNDTLYGDAGNDYIEGGIGNDSYYFTSGHDTLLDIGGTDGIYLPVGFTTGSTVYYRFGGDLKIMLDANNSITIVNHFGGDNIETLYFDGGSSVTLAGISTYTLQGDDGNNNFSSTTGVDVFYGMGGSDTLNGGSGNDILYGGTGNDTLNGGNDNDYMDGGAGNDTLNGGSGNDTYYYVSGHDIFQETSNGGDDIVKLAPGLVLSDLTFRRYASAVNDLKIEISGSNSITLKNQFSSSGYDFETLEFSDTSTINLGTKQYETHGTSGNDSITGIVNNGSVDDIIYGFAGNDTLNGGTGNDYLDGGDGDDLLRGNAGDDTYYYSGGHDTIYESTSAGGNDKIILSSEFTLADLSFVRYSTSANHLVIAIDGSNSITIESEFANGGAYVVETIQFSDESTLDLTNMSYTTYGTSGNDNISGIAYNVLLHDTIFGLDGNDTIYGNAGNDYIEGGAGSDAMYGGLGDDTFAYTSGLDTVSDTSGGSQGGNDKLLFLGSTTINDISTSVAGYHATIVINAGVDQITVSNLNSPNSVYHIERIEFSDGFSTTLPDHLAWNWGTSGGDAITGTSSHDTVIGKDGNDTLDGAGGDDDIHGGVGNDTLYGGSGIDLLHGGAGDDTLYGQDGLDTLYGGAGADTFVFQSATAFNNIDVIQDFDATDNDILDISDLLVGYTGMSDINDFMSVSEAGGNTTVLIDRDGTGGTYSSQSVMTLNSLTGLDVDDLFNNGNLIV